MLHEIKVLGINAKNDAKNDFRIKEIKAIKTQLVVTTGTNLFQHWMQTNSKLNKTKLTSLLTATTMKMNTKYWKPSP